MQGWPYVLGAIAATILVAVVVALLVSRKRRGVFEGEGARERARSASAMSLGGSAAVARIPSSRPSASAGARVAAPEEEEV